MTIHPATNSQSSFDLRPFGRMIWKEYRQQRMLWLVMLAAGLALQLTFKLALPRDPGVVGVLYGFAIFMPVLFVIGSSAMLFALEREERTSDWLASLAAPPQWTLLAKFGFLLLGTLALCGVMLAWALILSGGRSPQFEGYGYPERTTWWPWIVAGISSGTVMLLFAAWGTLGSLSARRVVEAVPLALVWWIVIVCLPMAAFVAWAAWFDPMSLNLSKYDRVFEVGLGFALLGVLVADVWLGWRWCRGMYVDAGYWDDLNERLSARLSWRKERASRVPVSVESEFSGWRVWQRLVWQERHRESLHRLLLVVVCAVGVMLPFFSRFSHESITFAVIPLIALLPVSMGVLGLRFDTQGQQLRFLAHRGASPLAIWSAKQVVWLPRAFWIPVACWGVAWVAEWCLVPGVPNMSVMSIAEQHYLRDGRHHVIFTSFQWLAHWQTVVWFILLSYGAGQLAGLLLRRFVLAAAVSLVLLGLITGWLSLMTHFDVPLWWSAGSLVVWMLLVTTWYTRHWLLERQTWSVVMALIAALLFPPLVVAGAVANYRWLEVPGPVLGSPWLFSLLYPQEAERRTGLNTPNGGLPPELKDELKAAEQFLSQLLPHEEQVALIQLRKLSAGFNTVKEFRDLIDRVSRKGAVAMPVAPGQNPPGRDVVRAEADLPADALKATKVAEVKAAFWAANESRLKEIVEVAQRDRCQDLDSNIALEASGVLMLPQRLLIEAGRLRSEERRFDEAFDYYCAALRLATLYADGESPIINWSVANGQQTQILSAIVEWSNDKAAANETLLPAISRVRDELARFPSMRETVVREVVRQRDSWDSRSSDLVFASLVTRFDLTDLLPTERLRAHRVSDQILIWQWTHIRAMEALLQQPGINAPHVLGESLLRENVHIQRDARQLAKTPRTWTFHPTFDTSVIVDREVTIRMTLLAMMLLEWKRVHGELPDSLYQLAPHILIAGKEEPERVLPVMTLNDPWTGALWDYSGVGIRQYGGKSDQPIIAVRTAGPISEGWRSTTVAAKAVDESNPNLLHFESRSSGILLLSQQGRLSLFVPQSR